MGPLWSKDTIHSLPICTEITGVPNYIIYHLAFKRENKYKGINCINIYRGTKFKCIILTKISHSKLLLSVQKFLYCSIFGNSREVDSLPFSDKMVVVCHNLKELVTGLLAVAGVEEVPQWYRPLQSANDIHRFLLCTPVGVKHEEVKTVTLIIIYPFIATATYTHPFD